MNRDKRPALVVYFEIGLTGFLSGDTWGILRGQTVAGAVFEGRDQVDLKFPGKSGAATGTPPAAAVDALMAGEGKSPPVAGPSVWRLSPPVQPSSTNKKPSPTRPTPRPATPSPAPLTLKRAAPRSRHR